MKNSVVINLSNRHVHLSQEDVEILFGKGHQLKNIKDLMQPGQFACDECISIKGVKGQIDNVRVLGPTRAQTQVEILQSDVYKLGKTIPPVRESGKLAGSAAVELIGPAGSVSKSEGMVIAMRHVHMTPADAAEFGVKDCEIIKLRTGSAAREVTFENVIIRVSPSYALECHIDFDEGNACGIGNGVMGEIVR
jgi:putative phosphotransacetylase